MIDQGPGSANGSPPTTPADFYGPSTLRLGIEKSRNLMTVRLAQAAGMDRVVEMVHRFGIDRGMGRNLASALGAGEVDLLSLTSAYATLVNGGKRIKPALIERIQDRHGKTVVRRDDRPCPACRQVAWQEQSAPALIDQREQVHPAAAGLPDGQPAAGRGRARHRRARALDRQAGRRQDRHLERAAAMPGSSASRPIWWSASTSASTSRRAWATQEQGASAALPIFVEVMTAGAGRPAGDAVPRAARRALVRVDAETGLLPGPDTGP